MEKGANEAVLDSLKSFQPYTNIISVIVSLYLVVFAASMCFFRFKVV